MEENDLIFSNEDFNKTIEVGSAIKFDKTIKKVRIDLTWAGEIDLDICAFMLKNHKIHKRDDLVYFGSKKRWRTEKPLDDPTFEINDALKGKPCTFEEDRVKYGYNNPIAWMDATLPLSGDDSVIGSWDNQGDSPSSDEDLNGETIHVNLPQVDIDQCDSIVIAATVSKEDILEGKKFNEATSPEVHVYNAENQRELGTYALKISFPDKNAVCLCKLEYDPKNWMWYFVPLAESVDGFNGGMPYLAQEVFEPTKNIYERY